MAFSVWAVAWYMQSIELFCADFAIGFLPPATFLLATANITIMLHKEFEVWFTLGNMLGSPSSCRMSVPLARRSCACRS